MKVGRAVIREVLGGEVPVVLLNHNSAGFHFVPWQAVFRHEDYLGSKQQLVSDCLADGVHEIIFSVRTRFNLNQ
jgi:hypothetical protein